MHIYIYMKSENDKASEAKYKQQMNLDIDGSIIKDLYVILAIVP